jgi:SAM-dependent methyltransferase
LETNPTLAAVERYYSGKVAEHGATPSGVDWRDAQSQEIRFAQLMKVHEGDRPFTINDYGCGYGALAHYLEELGQSFRYTGYDISERMLEEGRRITGARDGVTYVSDEADLDAVDYTVASGVFNVKLDADEREWTQYVLATLARLDELSTRAFSFNMLTSYSEPQKMRPDLYYGNPRVFFDHCKRTFSRWVALLHDYGLWEFTIVVRKEPHVA